MSNHPFSQSAPGFDSNQPPNSNSGIKLLLIILAIIGVLILLMCGGMGIAAYFAFQRVEQTFKELAINGLDDGSEEIVIEAIKDAPELKAEIGEFSELTLNKEKSEKEFSIASDTRWYNAKGSSGEATVKVTFSEEDRWFDNITIVKPDGSETQVTIQPLPHNDYDSRGAFLLVKDVPELTAAVGKITKIESVYEEGDTNLTDLQSAYQITGDKDSGKLILTYADDYETLNSIDLQLQKSGNIHIDLAKKVSGTVLDE